MVASIFAALDDLIEKLLFAFLANYSKFVIVLNRCVNLLNSFVNALCVSKKPKSSENLVFRSRLLLPSADGEKNGKQTLKNRFSLDFREAFQVDRNRN